jgi:amidase
VRTSDTADELEFTGLREQAELLRNRQVSARELTELSLSRIEATQPTLNAFRCVRAERALAEADEADRRLQAGDQAPLLGVPIAIKDDLDLEGETTAFGCAGAFEPKTADAEAVRRLREAGAVIVGKTNSPEFGQWPLTEGPAFGTTRNPWSLAHTPGGSSGGSAAAVAAGLVPAALGSDGLGSIRIPAAWTHLIGIKPQRGRISTWPDPAAFNGLTCIGPLARTVADAATLLDAASGNHAQDAHRPSHPSLPFTDAAGRQPRPLKIALSLKPPFTVAPSELDRDIQAQVERLAETLSGLGHELEHADPSYGVLGVSMLPRSTAGLYDWLGRVPDPSLLDPRTRHNAGIGRFLGGPILQAALALEPLMRRQVGSIFRRFDVVLAPTTAQPPLRVGAFDNLSGWATDKAMVAACPYAWPWNLLGWPGLNVPAGFTSKGLPVGAQLLGPSGSEALLISLAAQLEGVERWQARRPPTSFLWDRPEGDPA